MSLEVLQILWYCVVGAAIIFYVVLDGFDLGVGSLQLFGGKDENRRIFLNSIGPFWDGNEVWLIIITGGLFVGFPDVYAVVFSGFYTLFMLLLAGIIFRACAIEFRSKLPSMRWRNFWDTVFCVSSVTITFGVGLLLGNLMIGVPVDQERELYYSFFSLFRLYPVTVGIMSIFLFMMHGNHFLLMKTRGDLQKKLHGWTIWTITLFCFFFVAVTIWTWMNIPHMIIRFLQFPLFLLVPGFLLFFLIAMIVFTSRWQHGYAFSCSMATITLLFVLYAIGTYPNMLISSINEAYNLTLFNASASYTTMTVALFIAIIGIPLVFMYGYILYTVFRGKTELHDHSY